MRIVGVDPGKTTGICSFALGGEYHDEAVCVHHYEFDLFALGYFLEQITQSDVVVVEQYRYNPKKPANWSLEIIGLCRWFTGKSGARLVFRTPAQAKALCSNEVLKRAGLYFPGKGHACDAARLGLHWVLTDLYQMQHVLKEG
jgi:hypothetical protein